MNLKSTLTKFCIVLLLGRCILSSSTVSAQVYCDPSFLNGCFNWSNQSITLDSINWTLASTSCSSSDFTGMSTTLTAGISYPMTVTNGVWCGCAIWMDYNHDGDFDTTEFLYHTYVGGQPSYTYNFNITVPVNTPAGSYRMRVIAPWGSDGYSGTNGSGGCGAYDYGNFNDFTINVLAGSVGISNPVNVSSAYMVVSPNPAVADVTIQLNDKSGSDATLQLTDIIGKVIQSVPVRNKMETIDVSALPKGVYLIRYSNGAHHQTIRLNK